MVTTLRNHVRHPATNTKPAIQRYGSVGELRDRLKTLDARRDDADQSVILMLAEDFDGNLPSIIRRKNQGAHLIVSSHLERLPGLVARDDVGFPAKSLGWDRMTFVQDAAALADGNAVPDLEEEHCIVLLPEGVPSPFGKSKVR